MIAHALLPEFDMEMANMRKMLDRLPEDKLELQPDPKSMTMGRLAGHIAEMPAWGTMIMATDSFDMNPESYKPVVATSKAEVLALLDENVKNMRAGIAAASDEDFMKVWSITAGGQPMMAMPKIAMVRGMVLNHLIHHRGQLTVYYRMAGVPIPALYGPSGDEKM